MTDLRFAIRMLGRNRALNAIIVLLLALGIGAGTAIFSLFDAVVLRPLPVPHPAQLVRLVQHYPRIGARSSFRYDFYETLRDRAGTLSAVFGEAGDYLRFTLTDPAPAEKIVVLAVTPEYFDALGVQARLGRALAAQDAREAPGPPPAVLSYGFWARRFNADPGAIGRTLAVNGQRFAIVGVLPRDFNGFAADTAPDLRIPLRAFPLLGKKQKDWDLQLAGRLRPGVTRARAESEVFSIWKATLDGQMAADPDGAKWALQFRLALDPLERGYSTLRDRFGSAIDWLMASAILLAVLTCANIAGLLAARATARNHEIAVRLAVGATRVRLVRQMLAENSLITALGAAGGLAIAFVLTPLLARALPPIRQLDSSLIPLVIDTGVDRRVLLFSLGLSLATMLLFTIAPAIAGCRAGLDAVLRGARSSRSWRGRQALITLQIALCTFLLCGAGLQLHTFRKLHDQNPGFNVSRVATFTLDLTRYQPQSEASFLQEFTARVRRLPGVASAALSGHGVLRDRGVATTVAPTGQRTTRADFLNADIHEVSPEYFETMGIPILEGRALTPDDLPAERSSAPVGAVVNQAFARRFFPNVDPIGRRFGFGADKVEGADFEIVGLAKDAKYRSMRESFKPTFYRMVRSYRDAILIVRTASPPESILAPVRKVLASLDPSAAFVEVHTLQQEVDASTAGDRLAAALAMSFACLAALLAGAGIYGLLANAVTQRSREIGIRMAVGAGALDVAGLLWRQTMAMACMGAALGAAAIFWAGPLIQSLLYEVSAHDPVSLSAAASLVILIATVSAALPAWRAVQIDPATVLHE